ncbi:MAG: LamG-like jellyroll fold domain-containing protein [Planctomycetota bacterium]
MFIALALLGGALHLNAQHVHTDRPRGHKRIAVPPEVDGWHFAVYGDRTGGPAEGIEVLRQAVTDTNALDPDLVMTVGDLIQGYNTTPQWMRQMREFRGAMSRLDMPWFPVAGNHDIYWRGPDKPEGEHESNYEKHFGPLWYWFPHKNAAFVILYTDEGNPETGQKAFTRKGCDDMSPAQMQWLRKTLQETKSFDHVLVFLHHPRWRSNYHSNWDDVHGILADAGNVTAVFAGHIHRAYYDGKRDDIEYFTLATTGGHKSAEYPRAGWLHHFDLVTVREDGIHVAVVPVGQVVDARTLTPDTVNELGLLNRDLVTVDEPFVLDADGSATGLVTATVENPTRRPIEATIGIDGGAEGWIVRPGHVHVTVPPGRSEKLRFQVRRMAGEAALDFPRLEAEVAYIGKSVRVDAPPRSVDFPIILGELPEDVFAASDGGLVLADGACVRVPSGSASVPQGPFTLEGWFRAEDLTGRRPLLAKSESSEYFIFLSDAVPSFGVHLDGKYREVHADSVKLQTNRWYHIAGVFDGAEIRLYLDGTLIAQAAAKGTRTPNRHPFYIGADPNGRGRPVNAFPGRIDEVRLSTVARYEGEKFRPSRRHDPDTDTRLLFHFDRDVGPFAVDHSNGRHHGRRVRTARSEPKAGVLP